MALIKFGNGVAGISGKIAGTVFSRNHTGAYARNWAVPVNPGTVPQSIARQLLAEAGSAFTLLTNIQQLGWKAYGVVSDRLNRQGDVYHPTGRQLYIEQYINMTNAGLAPLSDPPSFVSQSPAMAAFTIGDPAEVLTASGLFVTLDVTVLNPVLPSGGDPADSKVLIYGTPVNPLTRNNVNNQRRLVVTEDATATALDISGVYNGTFGAGSFVGGRVVLWARLVDAGSGLASPLYQARRVTVAP